MATNSDSIYNILSQIQKHPDRAEINTLGYTNVVQLKFSDRLQVANPEIYFPNETLLVDRLSDEFVDKYNVLMDYFNSLTKKPMKSYHEVWVTTAHILDKKVYMLELAYE
ncbi:hypothetical protein [Pediococcus ethanolidurans]|uniref:Uncharacterized protein n=1 Tax=Pediococcus ethanolidurans TaxID=319653 RepID=A0A0R2K6H2_9LACO|nr:hypothetical protein [Pediococcus ethanolidurans]KRN81789.1 hypothetical protein IV87_GL000737 [Pediococcus ethanolidurans]MBU7555279.1 hypothetical protein [Pediococcus ethanolidurans]MBU7562631.1 hypothetical protein [Pediococcus ethanolidurans]MCT4398312.1 hypothetical protein [Pediococcus ethanolidurans]MCV3315693.1 hypothetical protein [Pediococcus ethanolidurans]